MSNVLKASPLKGIEVGSPQYFDIQKQLIRSRPLLKHCYDDWYRRLKADSQSVTTNGLFVELGSGGSLLNEVIPDLITSDVVEGVADQVIDARQLPFEDQSVNALFLTHVFHHIPNIRAFLNEARRVLVPGGVISMIEVAHTPLAKFIFKKFHPEPYDDKTPHWEFNQNDSMMDSNQAMSWNVFFRDRQIFEQEFPDLVLGKSSYTPWLSYLLSGGVTKASPLPNFLAPCVELLEKPLKLLSPICALHWHLCIRKKV